MLKCVAGHWITGLDKFVEENLLGLLAMMLAVMVNRTSIDRSSMLAEYQRTTEKAGGSCLHAPLGEILGSLFPQGWKQETGFSIRSWGNSFLQSYALLSPLLLCLKP